MDTIYLTRSIMEVRMQQITVGTDLPTLSIMLHHLGLQQRTTMDLFNVI